MTFQPTPDDGAVIRAQIRLHAAVLRSITADHYAEEGAYADAEAEYADEQVALAARDLTNAVEALPAGQQPVGWDRAEVSA